MEVWLSPAAPEGAPHSAALTVCLKAYPDTNLPLAPACLAHHQHFADVVAGEKELDGSEITEKIFDVAVVEHALQLKAIRDGGVHRAGGTAAGFAAQHNFLHLQSIGADDVEPVTGRVWTGIAGMKESQKHATRFQHRPEPSHDRLHQALIEIVRQIPAQHEIKVSRRVDQVIGEKLSAVQSDNSMLVFGKKLGIGGSGEQIFAVDSVAVFGEVANVSRRGRSQVEDAKAFGGLPAAR